MMFFLIGKVYLEETHNGQNLLIFFTPYPYLANSILNFLFIVKKFCDEFV